MKKERLIEAAKALNETKLSTVKVKIVAIKESDLKELFMSACEKVSVEDEDKLPPIVTEVYNELGAETNTKQETKDEKGEVLQEEKPVEETTKPKEVKTKVEPKPKAEKVVLKPFEKFVEKVFKEKDKTISSFLTSLLLSEPPLTLEQIFSEVKKMSDEKGLKNYKTMGDVTQHITYLKKKGYKFSEEEKGPIAIIGLGD